MRKLILLLLLTPAWAQFTVTPLKMAVGTFKQSTVKIGTLKYAGGSTGTGYGDLSIFNVTLNTAGITQPISFADVTTIVTSCPAPSGPCTSASQDLEGQGPTTTPITWSYYGGTDGNGLVYTLPNCNDHGCVCIEAQLLSATGQPFPVTLANGQTFTAPAMITVALVPLPGQAYIQIGQSVDIVLQRDVLGR